MSDESALFQAIVEGNAATTTAEVHLLLDQGISPSEILEKHLIPAMAEVGTLFDNNEYFVPELLIAARAMQEGMKILNPLLKASGIEKLGRVVIGTVKGDLHDIGKNLVASMLEGGGFEVIDLGVDVAPERFVEAAKEKPGTIVGLSALLTTTMPNMLATISALEKEGVRDQVRVIIGGAPVTQAYANEIGADGYSENANGAVALAKSLVAASN
jgi:Predicted cobalamin binding protein